MDNYKPRHLRIYTYATNRVIFHVEDMLEISKVAWELWAYQKGRGASQHQRCYMDLDDARLISHQLVNLIEKGGAPFKWTDYKGGVDRATGEVTARVLTLEWTTETRIHGLRVIAASGPGQLSPTQAVMPTGKLTSLLVLLPTEEALKLALSLRDHLLAWATASYYHRKEQLWQPPP